MTQSNPTIGLGLPIVARRTPAGGYRCVQQVTSTTYTTQRVCAMWVPAEAFKRGTLIIAEFLVSGAASTVIRIGGDGPVGAGVSSAHTANGAAICQSKLVCTQTSDGCIATFDISGGFVATTSSSAITTAQYTAFIQPLNLVELTSGNGLTYVGASLTVLPPPDTYARGGALFDK